MKDIFVLQFLLFVHTIKRIKRSLTSGVLLLVYGIIILLISTMVLTFFNLMNAMMLKQPVNRIMIFLLSILFIDLVCRRLFQINLRFSRKPYVTRIKKKWLTLYELLISFCNISNLISFVIVILLFKSGIVSTIAGSSIWIFLISWTMSVFILNSITSLAVLYSSESFLFRLLYWSLLVGLFFLLTDLAEYHRALLEKIFQTIYLDPAGIYITGALLISALVLQFFLIRYFGRYGFRSYDRGGFLMTAGFRKGQVLNWILIEIKLIFRIRRIRYLLVAGFSFQLYWFYLFYFKLYANDFLFLIFIISGLITTAFAYGQYHFSWDAAHFSYIMVQPINISHFLLAKVLVLDGMIVTNLVVPCLIFWNEGHLLLRIFLCLVYCLGVMPLIAIWFAIFNNERIDLYTEGWLANWQGKGLRQFLMEIPCIALPLLILAV